MKAKFFFLGLCALALAACSIDEVSQVNDTNAVTFKVTTSTRAEATTTNNIQEFTVWAWNDSNLFMDAVTATRSGSSSTFVTSPLYFWPTGGVDFYALTEVGEHGVVENKEYALLGGEINEGDDTNPEWTYEGTVGYAVVDNGGITIDACIPSKPEDQIDICYAVALDKSSGSVPTNFRHALSQVAFKAKSINSAFDVKIADVSVCSVYKEGTYVVGNTDTATHLGAGTSTDPASGSQGKWTLTTTDNTGAEIKGRYLVNMEDSIVDVPADGSTVELVDPYGTLMLLPQEVEAWDPLLDYNDASLGSYIRILCHVEEAGSQLWPTTSEEDTAGDTGSSFRTLGGLEYAEIAIPVDAVWEQGYRYTYTIIFGEGLGYYPPDDPNVDLEGTPVLRIITFDVTVDEFQDAEGIDVPTDVDLSEIKVSSYEELVGALRMGYEVIDVTADITVTEALNVYQDCVLNLAENVTISYDDDYVDHSYGSSIIMVYGGTLTINAEEGAGLATTGTYAAGDCSCIWLNGGNVIINGGSFYGASWNDDGTYTAASATIYVYEGFAYIYGGEFYGGYAQLWGEDSILNCKDANRKEGTAWIYVYGGDYYGFDPANNGSEGNPTNYCADGYATVYDKDTDCYTVYSAVPTSYSELEALVDGGYPEITITQDMELEYELDFVSDCVLTVAPGVTISVPDYESDYVDWSTALVKVWKGATVDIYAEGATFTTVGDAGSVDIGAIWVNDGTVNVYGGTYKGGTWTDPEGNEITGSSSACVYVEKGLANIYDGTFLSGYSTGMKQTSVLNCYATNYNSNAADIVCYGGTYQNFDPSNCLSEGANTNYCANGYTTTSETGTDGLLWYTVVENK